MRIFLAEDNLGDVFLIEEALRRQSLNFELEHYATAEEAIQAIEGCGESDAPVPDLIMLDYNLPRGNGSDILAVTALNPRLNAVPKVILTSFLQPDELVHARDLGATCFLTKPVNFDAFMEDVGGKIAELLQSRGKSQSTAEN